MRGTASKYLVVLSASFLSLVLGSVHAFSVFLEPLEQLFGASRATVSMIYSIALVSLTIAVLIGHKVFSAARPSVFVILVGLAAASGATIAAYASGIWGIWFGYGLIFGAANGFGYAFGLQMSAQANPGHEGVAMGIVTACYALGAMIAPPLFSWAVSTGGFELAMLGLAATVVLTTPICASLFEVSGARFQIDKEGATAKSTPIIRLIWLWLGYGAGVAAGLMAIGHATGIAKSAGLQQDLWIAPMIIAIFNMAGSFGGGWLADRMRQNYLLAGLSTASALVLAFLTISTNTSATLFGLGIVGFTYGALIAAYPASISKLFGVVKGTRIYGLVFTAWGTAGLLAPWFAGLLYDTSGGYSVALFTAAILGVISSGAVMYFYRCETMSAG